MIPLRDVIPSRTAPLLTLGLIAANAVAFLSAQASAPWATGALIASIFARESWLHLGIDVLYLWIFGDTVEDRLGHGRFVALYVLCAVTGVSASTLAIDTWAVRGVGAGSAVAGVMGAYFMLFPRSRVLTLVPRFLSMDLVEIPAVYFLGLWLVVQASSGAWAGGAVVPSVGALFWGHAAAFAAGAGLGRLLRRPERLRIEWIE